MIVSGLIFWLGLVWELLSLSSLDQAPNCRSLKYLRPILHKVPYQVSNLVGVINQLMELLGPLINAITRFVVKTEPPIANPFSSYWNSSWSGIRWNGPGRNRQNTFAFKTDNQQTSRLVNQLLNLARATPDAGEAAYECIDMNALCFLFTLDMLNFILTKNIHLGLKRNLN